MLARASLHTLYLRTLGIRLHLLRRWLARQGDRVRLPADLERLLTITDRYTMVDRQRRKNLWRLARLVAAQRVAGDFVELGVCNGGTAAVLASVASQDPQPRLTWCYDSFAGLPEPTPRDGEDARRYSGGRNAGQLVSIDRCVGSLETAADLFFRQLGLDRAGVRFVKGWFQETLGRHPDRPIALLHLDGDWYDSVKLGLDTLYDRVTPGGWIVLDDYGYWEGCRAALHDFFQERRLELAILQRHGYTQAYFQKQALA